MPSMIPPTILLVKVVLIASNEENRDWISPVPFLEKVQRQLQQMFEQRRLPLNIGQRPQHDGNPCPAMLTTARNRVKKISPKQMTVSKL